MYIISNYEVLALPACHKGIKRIHRQTTAKGFKFFISSLRLLPVLMCQLKAEIEMSTGEDTADISLILILI